MARKRRETSPSRIKLKPPNRSAPTEETLLQFAQERGLFEQAHQKQQQQSSKRQPSEAAKAAQDGDSGLSPAAERIMDTLLWMVSLSMLHFTLDVLVQNQYAVEISWGQVAQRAGQALLVFSMLFYVLHPHPSKPNIVPGLASRFQAPLRQAVFFATGTCAGCYLIHITNNYGYLAIMKQAPPLGCIWVWCVIELDLPLAVLNVVIAAFFLWQGGYDFQ